MRYTREERRRNRRDDICATIALALLAALFCAVAFCEAAWEPVEPDRPSAQPAALAQTVALAAEPSATDDTYDPYRADVPMDAETQRLLYAACGETGITYELALAVVWQETGYRNVVGDDGESIGYMQVQPKWHANRMERLGVTDLSDPYGNFLVGTDYLMELLRGCDFDAAQALCLYNAGRTDSRAGQAYAAAVMEKWEALSDGE